MSAAEVIAANVGHLQHPSGAVVSIPGFDRTGHPDLMEAHGKLASLIGEAVVHTLEQSGHVVTTADRIISDEQPDPWITLRCNRCRQQLMRVNIAHPQCVLADTAVIGEAMSQHAGACR